MKSIALLCALALTPFTASAMDWHVGVGAAGELDERGPDFGEGVDADTAGVFVFGATHENGFGVEASYVDLGEAEAAPIADAGYSIDGDLWTIGATYAFQTGPVQPFVKLGWFSRDEDGVALGIAGPVSVNVDDDGLTAEGGVRWRITDMFALRGSYAWYDFEDFGADADGSFQVLAEFHF